jgi:hypothetical protein
VRIQWLGNEHENNVSKKNRPNGQCDASLLSHAFSRHDEKEKQPNKIGCVHCVSLGFVVRMKFTRLMMLERIRRKTKRQQGARKDEATKYVRTMTKIEPNSSQWIMLKNTC